MDIGSAHLDELGFSLQLLEITGPSIGHTAADPPKKSIDQLFRGSCDGTPKIDPFRDGLGFEPP